MFFKIKLDDLNNMVGRRYDIDALRIFCLFLLMAYHVSIVFQPWADGLFFPKSSRNFPMLWTLMSAINIWRIPLLFTISGIAFVFAMDKRTTHEILVDRSLRILLPAVFGSLFIVPIHVFLFQSFSEQDLKYTPYPSHLWFLFNVYIYLLIALILMSLVKIRSPIGGPFLYILPILLVLESVLVEPRFFPLFAMTLHGFIVGGICFGFGCYVAQSRCWSYLGKSGFWHFIIAILFCSLRVFVLKEKTLSSVVAIEASFWLYAVLGLAYRFLNRPNAWLLKISTKIYPAYILHMIALYTVCLLVLPMDLPAQIAFLLILSTTLLLSFICSYLLSLIPFLRQLFGMK